MTKNRGMHMSKSSRVVVYLKVQRDNKKIN